MQEYYARLCWNTAGWRWPTGDVLRVEKNTFAAKHGFGHEEWLFDFSRMLPLGTREYHYGFLQPVNRSLKSFAGKPISVLLYSINGERERLYVGRIRNCEVLTDIQRKAAYLEYQRQGWISDMKTMIKSAGGRPASLDANEFSPFNVRFALEDAEVFDPPYKVAAPNDFVMRLSRYTLARATASVEKNWGRKGTNAPLTAKSYYKSATQGSLVDPIHKKLQNELLALLKKRHGSKNVLLEQDYIDYSGD